MSMILIVEDNPRNMKLVRDVLQVKGHADARGDHRRGRHRARKDKVPDLMLMDIQLPGMNGIEALARAARESRDRENTGDRRDRIGDAAGPHLITEAGFDGYVGKPINLAEFLQAVNGAACARTSPLN